MPECKVYRREIVEAVEGGRLSTSAHAHAASCRACAEELRERESLRALVGGLGKIEAPPDFEFRLRARMAAAKADAGRGRAGGARWLYGFAPVAVAACFVIVSATLYFRQSPPRATTTSVPAKSASVFENAQAALSGERGETNQTKASDSSVLKEAPAVASRPLAPSRKVRARKVEAALKAKGLDEGSPKTVVNSVEAARVIKPIAVKASAEPLRVVMLDERGARRVVPMRSVSFGSQNFLAREGAHTPRPATEVGGVW